VKAEYLRASFDQVKTQYGSIESYFEKRLGINRAGEQKLRDRFLQPNKQTDLSLVSEKSLAER
jgi:Tyrosine phosphatase family